MTQGWGKKVDDQCNVTDWIRVHKTNYQFDTCKPMWDPFTLRMSTLCNNNKKLPLRFSVHSFKNYGIHYCYGEVITSLREIEMDENKVFPIKRKNGKPGGEVAVSNMVLNLRPSLLAYLGAGWRISCGVAVDFTLSNKPYDDPRSLHA